jgi:sugar phosphate isomerase/epimerase
MSAQVELLASYWTIAGKTEPLSADKEVSPFDFRSRVQAAAKSGFKGIGLIHADLMAVKQRLGLKEMKLILQGNGIKYLELEILGDWFADGQRKANSDTIKNDLLTTAAQLGARHIKVSGDHENGDWPVDLLISKFADLCIDAANHGTKIALEIMPWTNVRTIEAGLSIVDGADTSNGGLLLDIWHFARGHIEYHKILKVPHRYIISVELDDADAAPVGTLLEDTIHRRKLCGEGVLRPAEFIKYVQQAGYDGPYGVEIISQDLRNQDLDYAAEAAFQTTMAQFGAGNSG